VGSVTPFSSDFTLYNSPPKIAARNVRQGSISEEAESGKRGPLFVRNNLGISDLLAFIEGLKKPVVKDPPRLLSPVEVMLFGPPLHLNELHPLVRDLYRPLLKGLMPWIECVLPFTFTGRVARHD